MLREQMIDKILAWVQQNKICPHCDSEVVVDDAGFECKNCGFVIKDMPKGKPERPEVF